MIIIIIRIQKDINNRDILTVKDRIIRYNLQISKYINMK